MIPVEFIVDGFDIRNRREKNCVFFGECPDVLLNRMEEEEEKKCKTKHNKIVEIYFKRNVGACAIVMGVVKWNCSMVCIIELPLIINDFIMIYGQTFEIIQIIALVHIFFSLSVRVRVCVSVYLWVHYLPLCECVFLCACANEWVYCHRPNANRLKTVSLPFFRFFHFYFQAMKNYYKKKERKKNITCNCRHLTFVQVSKQGPTIMNGQQNERAQAQASY